MELPCWLVPGNVKNNRINEKALKAFIDTVRIKSLDVQQIDRQSALQMSQKENNIRIPFTLTFHPHNHAVKSIILKKL